MPNIEELVHRTLEIRAPVDARRRVLLAISGVDASGKGFVAARVADALRARGTRVATINVDGWLNLPHVRFADGGAGSISSITPYVSKRMFAQLVLPLRDRRSVRVTADFAEETAIAFAGTRTSSTTWMCSCWIECSFETALERALARGQEGLLPERTGRAYRTIYFPAQETHFAMDDPRAHATIVVENDPRLAASPSV